MASNLDQDDKTDDTTQPANTAPKADDQLNKALELLKQKAA